MTVDGPPTIALCLADWLANCSRLKCDKAEGLELTAPTTMMRSIDTGRRCCDKRKRRTIVTSTIVDAW